MSNSAFDYRLDNDFIRLLVLSQPIPMKLAENISLAPNLSPNLTVDRMSKAKMWGEPECDPDLLSPFMFRLLTLICHGHTSAEIALRTHYSLESVKSQATGLLGIFRARNRVHMAALSVAQGFVDMAKVGK